MVSKSFEIASKNSFMNNVDHQKDESVGYNKAKEIVLAKDKWGSLLRETKVLKGYVLFAPKRKITLYLLSLFRYNRL